MPTYEQLLSYPEWLLLREVIAKRDGYKCLRCSTGAKRTVYYPWLSDETLLRSYSISVKIKNSEQVQTHNYLKRDNHFIEIRVNPNKIKIIGTEIEYNQVPINYPINFILLNPKTTNFCTLLLDKLKSKKYSEEELEDQFGRMENYLRIHDIFITGKFSFNSNEQLQSKQISIIDEDQIIQQFEIDYVIPKIDNGLNIHHKLYRLNTLPWDYYEGDLITLCSECHQKEHERNEIPVYDEHGQKVNLEKCLKCSGVGYIPKFSFYRDGICFDCWGVGYKGYS